MEKQDTFALMLWSVVHSPVMGNVTLTRNSSKLPVASVVAKVVKGLWMALSENI